MSERKGTKALELWCRRLLADYDGVAIENMTTSWRNGLAFCALIHRFKPDIIDIVSLKAEDIYHNNELAFRTAEAHLGIPALLDPEDMVANEIPDRLSILTYLSQFYQRLGHTVAKSPTNDNNNEVMTSPSPLSPHSPLSPSVAASLKLSKSGYEVCTACGLPVYLAQRLIVSRKLYHRRCFHCSSCKARLSPHVCYENASGTEFCCETCKNAEDMPPLHNEDDCMGMVMFHDEELQTRPPSIDSKRQSISDRIKLFESNADIKNKKQPELMLSSLTYCDEIDGKKISFRNSETVDKKYEDISTIVSSEPQIPHNDNTKKGEASSSISENLVLTKKSYISQYKNSANKLSFLQTQLSTDSTFESIKTDCHPKTDNILENCREFANKTLDDNTHSKAECFESDNSKINFNVPDDVRLEEKLAGMISALNEDEDEISVRTDRPVQETNVDFSIKSPPRRRNGTQKKSMNESKESTVKDEPSKHTTNEYPDDLNPFSDNDDDTEESSAKDKIPAKFCTNPFGSTDDEDEEASNKVTAVNIAPPRMNMALALNPFWSDGEEPSSDTEESHPSLNTPHMYKSAVISSTPNLRSYQPRRPKPRAPLPPVITVHEAPVIEIDNSYSLEDGASLSSLSSHCSTVNSETKPPIPFTPKSRKKRPAPTPPDNTSLVSTASNPRRPTVNLIEDKNVFADEPYTSKTPEGTWRRVKGAAPGLPLPGRRVILPELDSTQLQSHLDLLETQQLGLEKQGVLIEQMIREKCEGEHVSAAPPEEVEDLVIQLCELVNEKNDLFRKQAELMYIRRQQRLEQEQADIEHEIRVIQSRPSVNRIDADKAREEQLVARLVDVVRLRDELVQQLDSDRRRERAEDEAIAISIAERRAKRNSDSNNSSLQSEDTLQTQKKSKVKDRVKKQLKKAKNTLNLKKKSLEGSSKESSEKKEKGMSSSNSK